MDASFLNDMALVLGVAALTSVVAKLVRLPSVLGYLIAGFIVGPHTAIPLLANQQRVSSLAQLGVILVMFAIGMQFRIKHFVQVLPTSGLTAFVQISTMTLFGVIIGHFLGWGDVQAVFLGGALAISSTMIVSKVFEESPPKRNIKEYIYGILIIQDIVAIVMLTLLSTIATGSKVVGDSLYSTVAKLVGVLSLVIVGGILVIPRFVRATNRLKSPEVTIIVATGICFFFAMLVDKLGFSVALGAFLAGILVAESGESFQVEPLTKPLKDVFSAIFFVAIGMTVNPAVVIAHLDICILISAIVVVVQFATVSFAGIISGAGFSRALSAGLALGQIGEFGLIIAVIGTSGGLLPEAFQTIVVTVAVFTAISTPVLWGQSLKILSYIDAVMPSRLRLMITLYEQWFNQIRREIISGNSNKFPTKIILAIGVDTLLLMFLPLTFLTLMPVVVRFLSAQQISPIIAQIVVLGTLLAMILPIAYNLATNVSQMISLLTRKIFMQSLAQDLGAANKLFRITLQLLFLVIIGSLVMATLKPFISFALYLFILGVGVIATVWFLLVSAGKVETEIKISGEKLLHILARHSFPETRTFLGGSLNELKDILSIEVTNPEVIDKSLVELNIRAATGATVVAIQRGDNIIVFPKPQERIRDGDIVQLTGDLMARIHGRRVLEKNTE